MLKSLRMKNSKEGDNVPRLRKLKTTFLLLPIFFFMYLSNISVAGDSCFQGFSTIPGSVKYALKWDPDNPDEIDRNSDVEMNVIGGIPPYTWSVSGNGFNLSQSQSNSVSNTLNADGTACGATTITVTDYDGTSVIGYVRCTAGQWTLQDTSCGLSGAGTLVSSGGPSGDCMGWYDYELIFGNKKQTQRTCRNAGGGVTCPDAPVTNYCTRRCTSPCIDCNNCIDPDRGNYMPYHCPTAGSYSCWCVEDRAYYLWTCVP